MDAKGGAAALTSVDERWGPNDLDALRAHYEPLRRFAAVIGRWDVEPDDLVQEAFAKVLVRGSRSPAQSHSCSRRGSSHPAAPVPTHRSEWPAGAGSSVVRAGDS